MYSEQSQSIGRKLTALIALPAIAFAFLAFSTPAEAGDREVYSQQKTQSTTYKKRRGKGLLRALVDHHRKERSFILGLITGGERDYSYQEEQCCNHPEPVREYRREPARRYVQQDREPVRRYADPEPEPVRRYVPENSTPRVPAPAPVSPNSNYQYPGYSGY